MAVGFSIWSSPKKKENVIMLHLDLPTAQEIKALNKERADACVSIYLQTTPVSQNSDASRIQLVNLARQAREQLVAKDFDKRRMASLMEQFDDLADDQDFWQEQANSLALLATPDSLRSYRLASKLSDTVQVSDRFHLKPLLRSITFPHSAFVLALSENAVRLVEVSAGLAPVTVAIAGMPKSAASSVGKSTLNDRAPSGRIQGAEGQNVRFRQYARQVNAALRAVLAGRDTPLILAATGRLSSVFRSVNSYPHLLAEGIDDSPERITDAQLADASRPLLDASYQREVASLRDLYAKRADQGRATSDLSDAGRAATFGAIEALMVDIDKVVPGQINEETGAITFVENPDANTYGVIDEIAGRALANGARVLGVPQADLPGGSDLAAILRYPI
jgi:hypothetical protein